MPENVQTIVSQGAFQFLDSDTSDSEENEKVSDAARRKAFNDEYAEAERLFLSIGDREGAATAVAREYTASLGDEAARARLCTKIHEQYADTVQGQLVIYDEAKEYKSRGDNDKALSLLEPLASKVRDDNTALEVAITLTGLYAERGDMAKATGVMEKAYERQISKGGTLNYMTTYMLLNCYWTQQNVPACEKLVKDIMVRMKTSDGELNEIFGPEMSAPQQAKAYENFERMLTEKNFSQ
jgi:tetratricopeptide (TPR) repeat protein